jgi:hypothetical protein
VALIISERPSIYVPAKEMIVSADYDKTIHKVKLAIELGERTVEGSNALELTGGKRWLTN